MGDNYTDTITLFGFLAKRSRAAIGRAGGELSIIRGRVRSAGCRIAREKMILNSFIVLFQWLIGGSGVVYYLWTTGLDGFALEFPGVAAGGWPDCP
jgi:hypothetical protein